MNVKLIIVPEVEQDITEAYAWYENQRRGLGEEFLSCVDAFIQTILRMPNIHPVVYENYRRGLIRRFPYSVFYEYADKALVIYGIFHTARDPKKWRLRLR
jgi:plasmid stabilization system protein ParE